MPTAPIGVLGGTFDPIHFGHLRFAQEAGETLQLGQVRLVPSGTPPHRALPQATAADRLAMARLAVAGNPLLAVDEREMRREGPCYTVDTLEELRRELGAAQSICLLLGADAFLDFASWRRWHEIFRLAHLVIAHRPGFSLDAWCERLPQPLAREYGARLLEQPRAVHLEPAGGVAVIPITALDISATAIRRGIRAGSSPRYLLPDSVLDYIQTKRLYTR